MEDSGEVSISDPLFMNINIKVEEDEESVSLSTVKTEDEEDEMKAGPFQMSDPLSLNSEEKQTSVKVDETKTFLAEKKRNKRFETRDGNGEVLVQQRKKRRKKMGKEKEENKLLQEAKKRRKEKEKNELLQKAMKVIQEPYDDSQMFGRYVACQLRMLHYDKNRRKLQRNIQRVILEISELDDSRYYKSMNWSLNSA